MLQIAFRGVFVLMLVAAAAVGFGQETEPDVQADEAAEKATEEGRVFKDQIVVTPGRQEQASGDAPAPITVFDRDTIEKIQPEKMADLFKAVPGVEIDGEGPFRGLPVIRGLSSNRVLILVDGQRLNNARESTTFAGIQPALVNLAEVERIEVLRGPASVQYGSDAIGGVINIITRQPNLGEQEFRVNGDVSVGYGTISESQFGQVSVTGTGSGFSFYAGGTYEKVDDYTAADGASEDARYEEYVLEDNTVPNSGMEQTNFNGGLKFLTGRQGVLRIDAEVVRTKDVGFPGFVIGDMGGVEITFPNFDRDKIGVAWNTGPVWGLADISLSTYYQAVNKESQSTFDFFPGFFSDSFTKSEIDTIGFNAQSIADVGRHRLTFGLDFYTDNVEDDALSTSCGFPACLQGDFRTSTTVAVPESEQTGFGAYIQDQWTLSNQISLALGLRGDTFSFVSEDDPDYAGEPFDVTDSALSGNLGLTWSVTDNVNLTALVARGFRTPNLQERSFFGASTDRTTLILQNPDLSAESSWNYEIGTKVRYDRYSGGFHLFYNDLTDFITLAFLDPEDDRCAQVPPGLDCAQFANVDKATIWGAEFDLQAIFANWWTAFGSVAYMQGDNDITGEPLAFIPPLKVVLGLRYQRSAWWTEANLRFVDRQTRLPESSDLFDIGTVGFTVYDLRGGYDFKFGLGFLVAIENITDKLYNETFNNRPEPGRNFRITARYRF